MASQAKGRGFESRLPLNLIVCEVSVLYVRDKSVAGLINFIHTPQELRSFLDFYVDGTRAVLGDISVFTGQMRSMLLKLVEDHPLVDCYSSTDVVDSVLLSRFVRVVKAPASYPVDHSERDFLDSDRGYESAVQHLDLPARLRLLCVHGTAVEVSLLALSDSLSHAEQ